MDRLYKILIIGDSAVGKTSILNRFANDSFNESFISTIGVDFKIKQIAVEDKDKNVSDVKIQVWDTAGQERFRTITSSYYRGAHGIIIVFDISDTSTFLDVDNWMKEIDSYCINKNIQKILVGNKIDLERKVSYEDAHFLAMKYGLTYLEVSAKNPEQSSIDNIFKVLVNNIINNKCNKPIYSFRDDEPVMFYKENKDKGCC